MSKRVPRLDDENLMGKRLRLARILKLAKEGDATREELIALTEVNLGLAHRTATEYVDSLLATNILQKSKGDKLKLADGKDLIKLLKTVKSEGQSPRKWFGVKEE
jgi:hypothetical protein